MENHMMQWSFYGKPHDTMDFVYMASHIIQWPLYGKQHNTMVIVKQFEH